MIASPSGKGVYTQFRTDPVNSFEHVKFPSLSPKKQSIVWPTTAQAIHRIVAENLEGMEQVDPYQLTLGITAFPDVQFNRLVDITVRLETSHTEKLAQNNFLDHADTFRKLRSTISETDSSPELLVHLQTRLSAGYLFGWMFRHVTGFRPRLIAGDELWLVDGLPEVASKLFEAPPTLIAKDSHEIALVLSLSRNIGDQVYSSICNWNHQPRAIVEMKLEGNAIRSAAHALSIAKEVSWRIKTYFDQWKIERIHLFSAIPVNLSALITYHLNAIKPINLYFFDDMREQYLLSGTIANDL